MGCLFRFDGLDTSSEGMGVVADAYERIEEPDARLALLAKEFGSSNEVR